MGSENNHIDLEELFPTAEDQFRLAFGYSNGEGMEQDSIAAAHWYKKAASRGHGRAQYNLGLMHSMGDGIEQDYSEAIYWWEKAAENGIAHACFQLGQCYHFGHGVVIDYEAASHYLFQAAKAVYEEDEDEDDGRSQ